MKVKVNCVVDIPLKKICRNLKLFLCREKTLTFVFCCRIMDMKRGDIHD